MKRRILLPSFFPRVMKILGMLMVLFGLVLIVIFFIHSGKIEFTIPATVIGPGLMMIFFSNEKIDDERIHVIKFRSLVAGFIATYLFTMGWHSMTSHEFVVIVLLLSIASFYYLRLKL